VPEEDAVWAYKTAPWGSLSQAGWAEGKPDRAGPSATGSRAHVDRDPAEICGVASDWFHQGKERHPHCPCIWRKETEFRWPKLLGSRVLRLHGRARRGSDPGLHQESGGGRHPSGAIETLVTATFRWLH